MRQRLAAATFVIGLAVGTAAFIASPADAATTHTTCHVSHSDTGDACFYYLNSLGGSMTGIANRTISDVESPWIDFTSAGTGQGLGIGNAAGSERNGDLDCYLAIDTHAGFTGSADVLAPNTWIGHGQGATINNERSYEFGC